LGCDFLLGNPQELPLQGYVDTLQRWLVPQNKDWFAYKMSEEPARQALANSLSQQRGSTFLPEDIHLTTGAFAALAVCLNAVLDPGDEVIYNSPPWFFYEPLILAAQAVPVRVKVDDHSYDLDLQAIEAALSPRTRAIIINSPNNPTGRIYPAGTLERLARLLDTASREYTRPIFLLSDESYYRIVFDGRAFPSPGSFYPNTFIIYTYGKTLLTPGQRMGYVALPPNMPDKESVRQALFISQLSTGFVFPNALLQYALPELERLSIDIEHLQEKRDRLVSELQRMGYELHAPEGTFYLLPRSPWEDDLAFTRLLAKNHVYCLPGVITEMPGFFRISLTATDEMIERGLPIFAWALEHARSEQPVR
jgi:aspartate aminotransferase